MKLLHWSHSSVLLLVFVGTEERRCSDGRTSDIGCSKSMKLVYFLEGETLEGNIDTVLVRACDSGLVKELKLESERVLDRRRGVRTGDNVRDTE